MRVGEIINSVEALNKLVACEHKAILVYQLYKIIGAIEPEIQTFNKVRESLIKKYGKELENGNVEIPVDDKEAIEAFTKEITEITNKEVDINIEKIKISDIADVKISLENFAKLKWLIEDSM